MKEVMFIYFIDNIFYIIIMWILLVIIIYGLFDNEINIVFLNRVLMFFYIMVKLIVNFLVYKNMKYLNKL